jgi:hypothetical protein
MTTIPKNFVQMAANDLVAAFVTDTRANGESFVKCKDDRDEWIDDAVMEAHGGMMPDDMRYRMIQRVADSIAETLAYDADADLDDARFEAVDSLVPVYHSERFAWLASHNGRADYCDDARAEGVVSDDAGISDRIAAGIFAEYSEIWDSLVAAITERAAEIDPGDEA